LCKKRMLVLDVIGESCQKLEINLGGSHREESEGLIVRVTSVTGRVSFWNELSKLTRNVTCRRLGC
jgi:hypothetical protein